MPASMPTDARRETLVVDGGIAIFEEYDVGLASPRSQVNPGRLTQRLECHPHTVEVTGSNPVPPNDLRQTSEHFLDIIVAFQRGCNARWHSIADCQHRSLWKQRCLFRQIRSRLDGVLMSVADGLAAAMSPAAASAKRPVPYSGVPRVDC